MTKTDARKKDRGSDEKRCVSLLGKKPYAGITPALISIAMWEIYQRDITPNAASTRLKNMFSKGMCYRLRVDDEWHYWKTPPGGEEKCKEYYKEQQQKLDFETIIKDLKRAAEILPERLSITAKRLREDVEKLTA